MVWVGARGDWIESGENIVPGRGTHRGRLEAARKAHSFGGQLVQIRRVGLPTIATEIAEGTIIGDDQDDVWLLTGVGQKSGQESENNLKLHEDR